MSREYPFKPEGWEVAKLGDLVVADGLQTGPFGSQLKASDYTEDGIPVVMPKDLASGRISLADVARTSADKASSLSKHRLIPGDILFGRRGDIGRFALVSPADNGSLCGTGCLRARIDAERVLPSFVAAYLGSLFAVEWLNEHAVGQTMLNLNTSIIGELPVPTPPLIEQRRIADILSSVDETIQATQAVIEQNRKVKQSVLESLLTRGIGHDRFRQTEIGEIPESWSVTSLGSLSQFVTSGSRGWAQYYSDSGAAFLRIANLSRNTIYMKLDDIQRVELPEGITEGTRTRVEQGDILVSITADLGIIGYVRDSSLGDAYINQHIALVRIPPEGAHAGFIAYALSSGAAQRRIQTLNDAGAKAGLNLPTVRGLKVPLPSLSEQEEIYGAIQALDDSITAQQSERERLLSMKTALMSDLLTGRKRVSTDLLMAAE